ncbi:MAG: comGA [Bacillales bacterium]|jgi:competence protein ComGA|nr:comGA [Bacillales bacterium]
MANYVFYKEVKILSEIEKFIFALINKCVSELITDLHFIPTSRSVTIQKRKDLNVKSDQVISEEYYDRICTYLKYLAHLDVTDSRRPQSGTFIIPMHEKELTIRISTLPTIYGESIVLRFLYKEYILPNKYISIFPKQTKKLIDIAKNMNGLLIFSGPTGSGKTTTMYSLINSIKQEKQLNIITLEDPVEIKLDDVMHVQINEDNGLGYDVGLKAALRHDPDVILVGEIRDVKTALLAHRAALSGHLVLTTLHARDAISALMRFIEFGIPLRELQQSIGCVVSQRLINLICPLCNGLCTEDDHKQKFHLKSCLLEILSGSELAEVMHKLSVGERILELSQNLNKEKVRAYALGFYNYDQGGKK